MKYCYKYVVTKLVSLYSKGEVMSRSSYRYCVRVPIMNSERMSKGKFKMSIRAVCIICSDIYLQTFRGIEKDALVTKGKPKNLTPYPYPYYD